MLWQDVCPVIGQEEALGNSCAVDTLVPPEAESPTVRKESVEKPHEDSIAVKHPSGRTIDGHDIVAAPRYFEGREPQWDHVHGILMSVWVLDSAI